MPFSQKKQNMDLQTAFDQLIIAHEELWNCCGQLPAALQNQRVDGKWSALENVQHITKGVAAYGGYVRMDADQIAARFGTINRQPLSYQDLMALYHEKLNQGAVSTERFLPDSDRPLVLEEERNRTRPVLDDTIAALRGWNHQNLDRLVCPHPVLGALTAREMLFFTIFHAQHHTRAIQRIVERLTI